MRPRSATTASAGPSEDVDTKQKPELILRTVASSNINLASLGVRVDNLEHQGAISIGDLQQDSASDYDSAGLSR